MAAVTMSRAMMPTFALAKGPLSARRSTASLVGRPRAMMPSARRAVQSARSRQLCMVVQDKLLLEFIGDGSCDHLYDDVNECPPIPAAIEITEGVTVIGREPDDLTGDIRRASVPIATVSGTHAAIEVVESGIYVTDLGSTNGTYVDSNELNPNEAEKVFIGSEITFGDQYLAKFKLKEY